LSKAHLHHLLWGWLVIKKSLQILCLNSIIEWLSHTLETMESIMKVESVNLNSTKRTFALRVKFWWGGFTERTMLCII
jgi:hypothetical protein